MTIESYSDTECLKQGDCFGADDFISQSINESLFIAQKDNIKDTNQQPHFFNPTSLSNSEVEYTLTFDCFLNDISLDQIGQFSCSANAKYGTSFICGAKFLASNRNETYSDSAIILKLDNKNSITKFNSFCDNLEYFNSFSLFLSISSIKYWGEYSWIPLFNIENNKSNINPLLIKAEKNMFVSTTNIIYNNPCLLAMPNLTSSASFAACFSVIWLLDNISLATENLSLSTNSLMTLSKALLNLFSSCSGTSTFITTSAISSSPYYFNENSYLNLTEF